MRSPRASRLAPPFSSTLGPALSLQELDPWEQGHRDQGHRDPAGQTREMELSELTLLHEAEVQQLKDRSVCPPVGGGGSLGAHMLCEDVVFGEWRDLRIFFTLPILSHALPLSFFRISELSTSLQAHEEERAELEQEMRVEERKKAEEEQGRERERENLREAERTLESVSQATLRLVRFHTNIHMH